MSTRHRSRSRSPTSHHRHHDHGHHNRTNSYRTRSPPPARPTPAVKLPLGAHPLHKHSLSSHRPLFALYLDVQKRLDMEAMEEREVRGRWRSFVKKWNTGELAEGWYDPATESRANERAQAAPITADGGYNNDDSDEDADEIGPAVPRRTPGDRAGPAIPSLQDLEYRKELLDDDAAAAREEAYYERKNERKLESERLEELEPRADAASHERRLEKKRDIAAVHGSFRDAKSPGAEDIAESDLLGSEGIDAYRRRKKDEEMKKSERQLRREEVLRAKDDERKERLQTMKIKEDQTMDMLKALAEQRFGKV